MRRTSSSETQGSVVEAVDVGTEVGVLDVGKMREKRELDAARDDKQMTAAE